MPWPSQRLRKLAMRSGVRRVGDAGAAAGEPAACRTLSLMTAPPDPRSPRAQRFGHLHGDDLAPHRHLAARPQLRVHHDLPALHLLDPSADFKRDAERGRLQVINAEGRGDVAGRRPLPDLPPSRPVRGRRGRSRPMAVDEGRQNAPVHVPGDGDVIRPGGEAGHRLIPLPHRLQMIAVGVESAAPVAPGEIVGVVVLHRLAGHGSPRSGSTHVWWVRDERWLLRGSRDVPLPASRAYTCRTWPPGRTTSRSRCMPILRATAAEAGLSESINAMRRGIPDASAASRIAAAASVAYPRPHTSGARR